MKKLPGIFLKTSTVIDSHSPKVGNANNLKNSMLALINDGHIIAVGENGIEKEFKNTKKFTKWFDSFAPKTKPAVAAKVISQE